MKITMEIEDNGRWYRFVQGNGRGEYDYKQDFSGCEKCCPQFSKKCFITGDDACVMFAGHIYANGYFERFRPMHELVRIAVKILTHEANRLFPEFRVDCRGPKYPTDLDNEVRFYVEGVFRDDMPQELLAKIERLNALGLSI